MLATFFFHEETSTNTTVPIVLLPPSRRYKDGEEESVQKGKSYKSKKVSALPQAQGAISCGFCS